MAKRPTIFSDLENQENFEYFIDYYGPDGDYENEALFTVTLREFAEAIKNYQLESGDRFQEFASMERELIRDYLLETRGKESIGYIFSPTVKNSPQSNFMKDLKDPQRRPRFVFRNPDIYLGYHISKLSNIYESFYALLKTPLNVYQIYLSNGRSWKPPVPNVKDIKNVAKYLKLHRKYACVHGRLLYNLAGTANPNDPKFKFNLEITRTGLTTELDIAAGFDSGVVVHIGTCQDKKKGFATIVKSIEYVLEADIDSTKEVAKGLGIKIDTLKKRRKVILENSAGEGTKFGSTLEEIGFIINAVKEELRPQVKVCIDTAHIFGAGQYNFGLSADVERFYKDFDRIIGVDRLEVFHLNDSRAEWGSHRDLHENLGIGYIFGVEGGLAGLRTFINYAKRYKKPMVGEPPNFVNDKTPFDEFSRVNVLPNADIIPLGKKLLGPGGIWDYEVIKLVSDIEL